MLPTALTHLLKKSVTLFHWFESWVNLGWALSKSLELCSLLRMVFSSVVLMWAQNWIWPTCQDVNHQMKMFEKFPPGNVSWDCMTSSLYVELMLDIRGNVFRESFFTSLTWVREEDVALLFTRGSNDEGKFVVPRKKCLQWYCSNSTAHGAAFFFSFRKQLLKKLSLLVYQIVLHVS